MQHEWVRVNQESCAFSLQLCFPFPPSRLPAGRCFWHAHAHLAPYFIVQYHSALSSTLVNGMWLNSLYPYMCPRAHKFCFLLEMPAHQRQLVSASSNSSTNNDLCGRFFRDSARCAVLARDGMGARSIAARAASNSSPGE